MWTKERPTVPGFYWWRQVHELKWRGVDSGICLVKWKQASVWYGRGAKNKIETRSHVTFLQDPPKDSGDGWGLGTDLSKEADIEFWSESVITPLYEDEHCPPLPWKHEPPLPTEKEFREEEAREKSNARESKKREKVQAKALRQVALDAKASGTLLFCCECGNLHSQEDLGTLRGCPHCADQFFTEDNDVYCPTCNRPFTSLEDTNVAPCCEVGADKIDPKEWLEAQS